MHAMTHAVDLDLDTLADRIAATSASLDAATHRLLTDLRCFDERGGWEAQGMTSCAVWLCWRCGLDAGAAREKVRVARALGALPLIDDELRRGRLSYAKVRAMTRVATPENEARLLDLARGATGAQLEKMCRMLGQLLPRDPAHDEPRRWLRARDVAGGMVRVEAQLRPEEAARVLAACDVFAASAAERADALLTMAEATLRGDRPDRPPVEVMVHIDAATLTGAAGATGVSAETARRLLCDAGIVPTLEDAQGAAPQVGRKLRVYAGALRRVLLARAGGTCQFPGCSHTRYLHAHHVRHWIDGGETSLGNGCILCTRHHALVHEGGFSVQTTADGGLAFFRPDGRPVAAGRARPVTLPVVDAPRSLWDGDPVDYEACVAHALAGRAIVPS